MSTNSSEHLVTMANQIVMNISGTSPEAKIDSTANHIDKFWSPLMKKQIGEYIARGGQNLLPEAAQALGKIS